MPLARAVPLLPADEISRLWAAVRNGGADPRTVREVATAIVDCGAVQACYQEAEAMVEAAWRRFDPLLPNSVAKVGARALGTYAALRGPEQRESRCDRGDGQDGERGRHDGTGQQAAPGARGQEDRHVRSAAAQAVECSVR
ncbi:hypothetical protein ACGFX4_16170 [Kitasatospora sp. NPDC048365]|uniref:hypothetical protein n=1 Tax=Kitasatospora sp. NPDC048365 TaxID=3364050 RepID=UPI00371811AB